MRRDAWLHVLEADFVSVGRGLGGLVNGELNTDAFDSRTGRVVPAGGAVGANGVITVTRSSKVGGTVWSSANRLDLGNSKTPVVGNELHINGAHSAFSGLEIGSNGYINGNLSGNAKINGTLFVPTSASVDPTVTAASVVRGPVVVPPPCDCSPSQLIDISAVVQDGKLRNDNSVLGLDPAALTGQAERLDLPCGRYYLDRISNNGAITIAVHGRTGLFIGGNINANGALQFALDPQASLDVFIDGDFDINGSSTLGSTLVPRQLRLYVSGRNVTVSRASLMAGNIYAPRASFISNGPVQLYGAILANSYLSNGDTTVRYDSAVLGAGSECRADGGVITGADAGTGGPQRDGGTGIPGLCRGCADCANQACVNGACGSCSRSDECCAPLVCIQGRCVEGIN
jgi:hypothetical protein